MIISPISKMIDLKSVFSCRDAKYSMWIIKSHETFAEGRLTIFEIVPVIDWEPHWDKATKTDQYSFLEGSGFGGGPAFIEDLFYKHNNGAIYREIEIEKPIIDYNPGFFERLRNHWRKTRETRKALP